MANDQKWGSLEYSFETQLEFKFYDINPEQIELPLEYPTVNYVTNLNNNYGNFSVEYNQPTVTFTMGPYSYETK